MNARNKRRLGIVLLSVSGFSLLSLYAYAYNAPILFLFAGIIVGIAYGMKLLEAKDLY